MFEIAIYQLTAKYDLSVKAEESASYHVTKGSFLKVLFSFFEFPSF